MPSASERAQIKKGKTPAKKTTATGKARRKAPAKPPPLNEAPTEDFYTGIFHSSPQAMLILRLLRDDSGAPEDLLIVDATDSVGQTLGIPEHIGHTVSDLAPDYRSYEPDMLEVCSRVDETGIPEEQEAYHPRLEKWFHLRIRPTAAAGHMMVIVADITERKRAESSIRRLQYSLDQVEDYPIWSDESGQIAEVSESTCRHLEYSREELLSMKVFDLNPDFEMDSWKESWREDRPQTSFRMETQHRTKSGRVYPIEVTVNPMVFDGKPYHCAFCRDITEHKQANERSQRLQYSLDRIDDYPAWTDSEGYIVEVSESTCRHLEYSREELLTMHVRDICPDINLEGHEQSWEKGADQQPFLIEVHHRTKSGRVYPVEVAVNPMVFHGKPYHCALCRDISDRRSAEDALRDSEELHRQLFELESDAIILADQTTGQIVEVNQAACDLYGYSRTEFKSLTFSDLLAESVEPLGELRPGEPMLVERLHKRKDGTFFPAHRSLRFFNWRGREMHVAAVRDITSQKRAAEELEESKRMLQLVLDTVPSPILWRDRDLRYLGCNAAAAEHARLSHPSEIVGLKHHELPVHRLGEKVEQDDREVIESGVPRLGYEETVVRSNGETVVLRSSKVPLRSSTGEVMGVLSIYDDITEQTETLNALRDRDEQLLQAQKMEAIGRLAGGIAHDFNNVLTTIVGYSDLILSSPDCPEGSVAEDIAEIKDAAERAGALTQRILAFSRRQNLQPALLSLNDVVIDTEKLLARTIGADIELATSLAAKLGRVEVDEHQFVQVLLNLAVNARDAMPKGGKLTIATADVELDEQFCETHPEVEPGHYVMLTVTDTGSGMDEEVLGHVFEPFYTTKPPGLGTGLGLATVYGIVAQSGGCIYVHSKPDRGTTFTIYLPRIFEDSHPPDSTGPDQDEKSGPDTIMVVDSDAPYLALTTRILERRGFRVLSVSDGEKAAKMLADRSTRVTGLVTDLVLSGALQGEQLAELAVRRRPGLRLLFVSSDGSDAQTTAESSQTEASYLEKPFTAEELHREVRTWVTEPDSAGRGTR